MSNSVVTKRKNEYRIIFDHFQKHKPWTEKEMSIPITQSNWFTQLVLLMVAFTKSETDKASLAYEIFGSMCHYISRSYSIEPATDLVSALEVNSIRVGTPPDASFLIILMRDVCSTGYSRCGTTSLMQFVAWFHSCDISLRDIRENLIMEYQRLALKSTKEEASKEKIAPKPKSEKASEKTKKCE